MARGSLFAGVPIVYQFQSGAGVEIRTAVWKERSLEVALDCLSVAETERRRRLPRNRLVLHDILPEI